MNEIQQAGHGAVAGPVEPTVRRLPSSVWRRPSEEKPNERQGVLVCLHSWSMCTDGKKHFFENDNGVFVMQSWYTNKPFPSETGHFVDGFAFQDGTYPGTLHRRPTVTYWMPIPEIPSDA